MPQAHLFQQDEPGSGYCKCGLQQEHAEHEAGQLRKNVAELLRNVGSWAQCKGCRAPIYWVTHNNGKKTPYNELGLNHFVDCPARDRFKQKGA